MSQGWNCKENIMQVTRGGQRQQELVTIIIFFREQQDPRDHPDHKGLWECGYDTTRNLIAIVISLCP